MSVEAEQTAEAQVEQPEAEQISSGRAMAADERTAQAQVSSSRLRPSRQFEAQGGSGSGDGGGESD